MDHYEDDGPTTIARIREALGVGEDADLVEAATRLRLRNGQLRSERNALRESANEAWAERDALRTEVAELRGRLADAHREALRELGCRIGMDDYVPESDGVYWNVDNVYRHVMWLEAREHACMQTKLDAAEARLAEATVKLQEMDAHLAECERQRDDAVSIAIVRDDARKVAEARVRELEAQVERARGLLTDARRRWDGVAGYIRVAQVHRGVLRSLEQALAALTAAPAVECEHCENGKWGCWLDHEAAPAVGDPDGRCGICRERIVDDRCDPDFRDPEEAHRAYLAAAVEMFGEFANDGHGPVLAHHLATRKADR